MKNQETHAEAPEPPDLPITGDFIGLGLGVISAVRLSNHRGYQNKIPEKLKCVGDINDKESSRQGRRFEDFKSVYEVVRLYKLPNQKTRTSPNLLTYKENFEQGKICEPWHVSNLCLQD